MRFLSALCLCPALVLSAHALSHTCHSLLVPFRWSPSIEDQAVDRVHRLGQTKEVHVVRFVCRDSVEEKIMELQNSKREMASVCENTGQQKRGATEECVELLGSLLSDSAL